MEYSIVVPVFKSSQTLPVLVSEINGVMKKIGGSYEIVLVDDCSPDNSWEVLKSLKEKQANLRILRLANNVGQWMATIAGIRNTRGSLIITIDDDLEYDTADIENLVRVQQQTGNYIVYGIPTEKKNKNLSYRLFFSARDRFLRVFFDKAKTESFKIFRREIYFGDDGKMFSHLHFEAYTKFTVATKFVGYVHVNYRKRYFGNSNHTLYMKFRLMIKYGIEYYRSPFKYPLYTLLLLVLAYLSGSYAGWKESILLVLLFAIAFTCMLIVGILGKYLSSIYFKIKGLPEYIIIERAD